jgi:hypothetical protein
MSGGSGPRSARRVWWQARAVTLLRVNKPSAGEQQLSLEQLIGLLASANDPKLGYTGVLSEFAAGEITRRWRVWRLRDLARIEDPPGRLSLVAGRSSFWRPLDGGVERIPRTADARINYDLNHLVMLDPQEYWAEWLSADPRLVTSTLHMVEHQGRAAWRFTAPPAKGGSPVLTVDAELGLRVRAERPDVGCFEEWSGLAVDPLLDASFFEFSES